MYLLSGMVYYDPPFYCNLTKPPSLLLSLSRPSLLMCSLRGPTWPARGSWWHSERNTPPTTPYPPHLGQEMFNHGLKSLTLNLLTSENVNGSIQRRQCSSSSSDQCSILVAFCDISWICGCIYTELCSSPESCCASLSSFHFVTLGVSCPPTSPPNLLFFLRTIFTSL